jgi:pyruvate/2-oxoglutarate dehydrogenase complex dihydrolipoamide acyltransferase (E2) component
MLQATAKDWRTAAFENLLWLLAKDRTEAEKNYASLLAVIIDFLRTQGVGPDAKDLAEESLELVAEQFYRERLGLKVAGPMPAEPPNISSLIVSSRKYQKWREAVRPLAFLFASRARTAKMVAELKRVLEGLRPEDRRLLVNYREINEATPPKPTPAAATPAPAPAAKKAPAKKAAAKKASAKKAVKKAVTKKAAHNARAAHHHEQAAHHAHVPHHHTEAAKHHEAGKHEKAKGGSKSSTPKRSSTAEFTAYFPRNIQRSHWNTLLAYMHLSEALPSVESDSKRRFSSTEGEIGSKSAEKNVTIARGTEIQVVPESESLEFNPPQVSFVWLENYHCAEFRFKLLSKAVTSAVRKPLPVRVGFYVSPMLVAAIDFTVSVGKSSSAENLASAAATPYQRIFVSYSHKDSTVADSLERAYKALGNEYLRDINTLRSGEEWNPALLKRIDEAEIFQLLWSNAARSSKYVRQEWKHALGLSRRQFIRPVYWRKPMPPVPPELAAIHFAFVDF